MKKLIIILITNFCIFMYAPKIIIPYTDTNQVSIKSIAENLKNGEIRKAAENADFLSENNPKSAEAHALYALALISCGEYEKADAELKLALSLDKESPETHLGLGMMAYAKGDTETAILHLNKAASTSYLPFMTFDLLAINLSSINQHKEAKEVMMRAHNEIPDLTEFEKNYLKNRIKIYGGYQDLNLYQIPDEFQSTTLGFTNSEGHILAPIKVNGLDIGEVHLDTGGSGGLTVAAQTVDNLDLKIIGQVTGANVAQEITADVVMIDEIQIGELIIKNVPVNLYRGGQKFHGGSSGNLGKQVIQRLNLTIDYKNSTLTFFHPNAANLQTAKIDSKNASEKIPFYKDKFIIVRASINNQDPEPFILDTGAGITVFHADYYLESINPPEDKGESTKLEAPKPFTLDSIVLGGRAYKNVMSIAMDLSQIYKFGKVYYPGIIGNPIFQKSRLHFDFTNSTLVIEEVQEISNERTIPNQEYLK